MDSGIKDISVRILRPRFTDGAVLVFLLVLTFFSPRLIPAGTAGEAVVVQTADNSYEISLKEEGSHIIDGPLGRAVLVIKDGEARLSNAPCPLRICESMGPVGRAGDVILCLPNRIYIRVTGEEEIDAVSR